MGPVSWAGDMGQAILSVEKSLDDLANQIHTGNLEPQPRSGQQEYLDNLINRFV